MDPLDPKIGRLFRSATKSGKVSIQPIGINTMGAIPRKIAEFLQLAIIAEYSGHSFQTSARVLNVKGIGLVTLKQYGRWKSTSVCERYATTTTVYFNEVVFPSVLGLTSPMAFPQHSPPS